MNYYRKHLLYDQFRLFSLNSEKSLKSTVSDNGVLVAVSTIHVIVDRVRIKTNTVTETCCMHLLPKKTVKDMEQVFFWVFFTEQALPHKNTINLKIIYFQLIIKID